MMERLLNDLLMGKTPQGESAKKPGFMIIGTQNPASMAGRSRASKALQHRMQQIYMPEYQRHEMVKILEQKGLSQVQSTTLVDEYLINRKRAAINPLLPKLCFRDLLKRAQQKVQGLANSYTTQGSNIAFPGDTAKEQLIHELNAYIKRIDLNKKSETPDFARGFLFFKNSRAINREANYALANYLLEQLISTEQKSIATLFEDLMQRRSQLRNAILIHHGLEGKPGYPDWGIQSTELKQIIEKAKRLSNSPIEEILPSVNAKAHF